MTSAGLTNALRHMTLALGALTLLAGCPSIATLHTATPVGKGKMEVTASPGVAGWTGLGDDWSGALAFGTNETSYYWVPTIDVAFRYGVTDDLDVGFALSGFYQFKADVKLAVIDNHRMTVAIGPSVGVNWAETFLPELPVYIDLHLGEHVRINLAGKYAPWVASNGEVMHAVGGHAGMEFLVNDDFAIAPGVDLLGFVHDTVPDGALFATFFVACRVRP